MKKKITLFDFDGTLTRHDSFTGFIRHVRGLHGLFRVLLVASPEIIRWKLLGTGTPLETKLKLFSAAFRGMPAQEFRAKGKTYAAKIDRMLRRNVYDRLRAALRQSDRVALVSASLRDWIEPWANANGVTDIIATEAETDSAGRLTGRFSTPECTHAEKVTRLLEAFPQLRTDRADYNVTAYGDSRGDQALFNFADNAYKIVKGNITPIQTQ